jgi:hypothetical protein
LAIPSNRAASGVTAALKLNNFNDVPTFTNHRT